MSPLYVWSSENTSSTWHRFERGEWLFRPCSQSTGIRASSRRWDRWLEDPSTQKRRVCDRKLEGRGPWTPQLSCLYFRLCTLWDFSCIEEQWASLLIQVGVGGLVAALKDSISWLLMYHMHIRLINWTNVRARAYGKRKKKGGREREGVKIKKGNFQ